MAGKLKILFIAWDSPSVAYLEGLFLPIFEGLMKSYSQYEFHVIQFSWADVRRQAYLKQICSLKGIKYSHFSVTLKPVAAVGKILTLFRGASFIREYVRTEGIQILMPRSSMPARLALAVKRRHPSLRIVFDADGLPIEERVDFAGLKKGSFRYRQLKAIEKKIITVSDAILVRSRLALEFLRQQYTVPLSRFFVVRNGRDAGFFRPGNSNGRLKEELGIPLDGFVCVYCGSLGPQYGVEQMLYIHRKLVQTDPRFYFLVLTKHSKYLLDTLTPTDKNIVVKDVPFTNVAEFLKLGDVAFAIRKASASMRGVAPIKIGEYLLTGLPVIASSGIGDTETLLSEKKFAFLLKDYEPENLDDAVEWVKRSVVNDKDSHAIRTFAEEHFSLETSVESYHEALQSLGN